MDGNDKEITQDYISLADGYYIASTYKGTICVEECYPELNNDTDEVKSSVT